MRDLRRVSTVVALVGSVLLAAGVSLAIFLPLGTESSTSTTADGTTISAEHHVSLWQSQNPPAAQILGFVLGFCAVAVLLVRFGGPVGRLAVAAVCGLGTLASMLTIGILLLPGASLLGAGALLGEAAHLERIQQRRIRRRAGAWLPPPPPPLPPGPRTTVPADDRSHLEP